jgi:hypothetical protein
MRMMPETLSRLAQSSRLPLNLFADHDRFSERLDALQDSMPSALPRRKMFKH